MAENKAKNYKAELIEVELYTMEQQLNRFKQDFEALQKRAKEKEDK